MCESSDSGDDHHGSCFSFGRCECPFGYEGIRCEVNADDCADHSCQNNSTCIDKVGSYECECARGFSGAFCQNKIAFCSADFSPCQNGGKCVDHFTHYTCECLAGFSGENCTKNVDDCVDHMCQVRDLPERDPSVNLLTHDTVEI